jgi:hypothetical protein
MAYNKIPKSLAELDKLNLKYLSDIVGPFTEISKKYNIKDPFAFDPAIPGQVKIVRSLQEDVKASTFNTPNVKFTFGNGTRGGGGANNAGLLFERELYAQIQIYLESGIEYVTQYKDAVEDIMALIPAGHHPVDCDLDGGKNTPRPLDISSSRITTGKKAGSWDIGKAVTDLTLWYAKGRSEPKALYLSLKLGGTVTFVNAGVKKYLMEKEMVTGEISNAKGKLLLKMFSIDEQKFSDVFNNYTGKGSGKEKVKLTNLNNPIFKEFMQSVIGYGYVLVHKVRGKVYTQMIDKATMNKFINVKSAEILYPKDGSAKRIDIVIEMNGITIKINIRNKQGGLYPSHIMADYVMEH